MADHEDFRNVFYSVMSSSEGHSPEDEARRREINEHVKQYRAAVSIQKVFRGYIFRVNQRTAVLKHSAARKIQTVWREYRIRWLFRRLEELIALARIAKAVMRYRNKLAIKKKYKEMAQLDPVLAFYPAKSRPPEATRGRRGRRGRGGTGRGTGRRKGSRKLKKEVGIGAVTASRVMPKPLMVAGQGGRRKRKVLVDLPPPWHSKDARRLSITQQDEMLYEQRNNLAWVKSQVMPLLMRKINAELDQRNELVAKNEKYMSRTVQKPFLFGALRNRVHNTGSTPKLLQYIREVGVYVLLSSTFSLTCEVKTFADDGVIIKHKFDVPSPLYDIVIHPKSGYIIGLDNRWCLRLFNGKMTVITKQLEVVNPIPVVNKFMAFDKYGLLWVNMIPQKGNFMCFDPLTLSMTIQVNLDALGTIHRFMRSNVLLMPLCYREPIGFVGIFAGMTDLVLFNQDFGRARHLKHPQMKAFPSVRQISNRLFVWSHDKVIYVYDVRESIDHVHLAGSFEVSDIPVDVCCTNDPDLIFVGLEDCTLRVFLGGKTEYPMRLPESKLTKLEMPFADAMLGTMKFTTSRPAFREMISHRFSAVPFRIDAISLSSKLAVVTIAYSDSSIQSFWVFNDAQTVRAIDFDEYNYDNTNVTQLMTMEFQTHIPAMNKRRAKYMELRRFLEDFDAAARKGSICNIFQPKAAPFILTKFIRGKTLHGKFSFIPVTEKGHHSAYETFHFLRRSGVLPAQLFDFAVFIKRFTPDEYHRHTLTDGRFNQVLPVRTSGVYNTITQYIFTDDQINKFISDINPVACLKQRLSVFTLTLIQERTEEDKKEGGLTARTWLNTYEKAELTKRMGMLAMLEDDLKHELMVRVQRNIDEAFQAHQLDRMVPVPAIDIHQHFNSNDCKRIYFSEKPHRNPLLNQNCHGSIYSTWANRALYGRDMNVFVDLKALFVPSGVFGHPVVQSHFEMVRRVAMASKKITKEIYSYSTAPDGSTQVVVTDDSKALPLSHYVKIHSFLGGNSRLLMAARSILSRVLTVVYQLHKSGIILRTLLPCNILLNAQTGSVTIGDVFDCEQMATETTPANYLPLPPRLASPSNPFLPPEYFHESPSKYTTAFDVWQFGVLLLYVLTGFEPPAYGKELIKHIEYAERAKQQKFKIEAPQTELDDPPIYPRINFFYDWLKGCNIYYMKKGERNIWTGELGECYIRTEHLGPPSILALDHYYLLPYKNTKIQYDESRLFLEIIASCLQIDPEKRPTIEQLLRTYPFNQTNQIGDILDQYMRQPNPKVFVREFFKPSLDNLTYESFPFTLGIIGALIFHEEMAEEDAGYSFPLDTRAAEQVISALFDVNFIDQLVVFVLGRIESRITYSDVNPNVKFQDETFTRLLRLFERFVGAVEHGHGALLEHMDEVVLSLLALYTGNPYLRHGSEKILKDGQMLFKMSTTGSAALFVFTYTQMKAIISHALRSSSYILSSLHRTAEHNDGYFKQFVSFGDSVYGLANAMCHSIEKQRMNAIMIMENLWNYGQVTHVIRLFIDYRVPQMVIHCLMNSSARVNAMEFINDAMVAIKLKSFDPTYMLLHSCVHRSPVMQFCAAALKSQDEEVKQQGLSIINRVVFGDSAVAFSSLYMNDVVWTALECCHDPKISDLMLDILYYSSPFVVQVLQSSQSLKRALKSAGLEVDEDFDFSSLSLPMDAATALEKTRRLASTLFIRQSSLPADFITQPPPLRQATEFLMKTIDKALEEADFSASCLDNQVAQSTRFDLKGTTYLKAKATAKSTDFADTRTLIAQLCDVMLHLFRCLCFYWRTPDSECAKSLFKFILQKIQAPIPVCESVVHPAYLVHHCLQRMAMHTLADLPPTSPVRDRMLSIQEIWPKVMQRDIAFVIECAEKDIVEIQLPVRYPEERRIRQKMFQTLVVDKRTSNLSALLRFIVRTMLHNRTEFKASILAQHYKFPIRSEAVNMVMFLLSVREKYESAAKRLAEELVSSHFIEEEKKLTDNDPEQQFIDSSIILLRTITECKYLFEDSMLKLCQAHLETLCMRFSREWMSTTAFQDTTQKEAKSPQRTQVKPAPKLRALTNLGGSIPSPQSALLPASFNLQGLASARLTGTKTSRSRMTSSRMTTERAVPSARRRPKTAVARPSKPKT